MTEWVGGGPGSFLSRLDLAMDLDRRELPIDPFLLDSAIGKGESE